MIKQSQFLVLSLMIMSGNPAGAMSGKLLAPVTVFVAIAATHLHSQTGHCRASRGPSLSHARIRRDLKTRGDLLMLRAKNPEDIDQAVSNGLAPSEPIQWVHVNLSEHRDTWPTHFSPACTGKFEDYFKDSELAPLMGHTPLSLTMLPDRSSALTKELLTNHKLMPGDVNRKCAYGDLGALHVLAKECRKHSRRELKEKLTLLLAAGADVELEANVGYSQGKQRVLKAEDVAREQAQLAKALFHWHPCNTFVGTIEQHKKLKAGTSKQ